MPTADSCTEPAAVIWMLLRLGLPLVLRQPLFDVLWPLSQCSDLLGDLKEQFNIRFSMAMHGRHPDNT